MSGPETPLVDIDIDELQATALAEKRATAPEAIQARSEELTPSERIAREVKLQTEYVSKRAICLELEEKLKVVSLPDMSKVSAGLPREAITLMEDAADGLMQLSLYKTTARIHVLRELESMIKKNRFGEEVERMNTLIAQSQARVTRIQTEDQLAQDSAQVATDDEVRVNQLLRRIAPVVESVDSTEPTSEILDVPAEPGKSWFRRMFQ